MKKTFFSTLAFLSLALGYLFYYYFYVQPKDIKNYERFIKDHQTIPKSSQKIKIEKTGIKKDIWQKDKEDYLHSKIFAKSSTLFLEDIDHKHHITEKMQDAKCVLDEAVSTDTSGGKIHHVKVIYAREGLYDYKKNSFGAKQVDLSFFDLTKAALETFPFQDKPYFQGRAYNALLSFKHHKPSFEASCFDAATSSNALRKVL